MKQKLFLVAIISLILIGVSLFAINQTNQPAIVQNNNNNNNNESDNQNVAEDTNAEDEQISNGSGIYIDYNESNLGSEKNVIFFAASWCPSCRELDRNLLSSINEIPDDLIIHKADFDDEVGLRQKYGVTLQHTFVQVDQNGELIKSWNGLYKTYSLSEILSELI